MAAVRVARVDRGGAREWTSALNSGDWGLGGVNSFVVVSRLQALECRSQAEGAAISGMKAESQWPVAGSNEFLEMAVGFCKAPEYALSLPGPHLIDALVLESLGPTRRKIAP